MKKKANQGFSLVEVVIAIAILAIVALPLFSAFAQSAKTNAKARKIMNATNLAQNIVEEIKANGVLAYSGLTEIGASSYENVPVSDGLIMGSKQYYAKVSISPSTKAINNELVFPFQGINPGTDAVYQCSEDLKKEISQVYLETHVGKLQDYTSNFNDRFYLSNLIATLTENEGVYLVSALATYQSMEKQSSWTHSVTKIMYNSTNASSLNLDGNDGNTGELEMKNIYVFYCNKGLCKMEFRNETSENVDEKFYIINQAGGLNNNSLQVIVDGDLSSGYTTNGATAVVYHNFLPGMVFAPSHCDMSSIDSLSEIDKRLFEIRVDIFEDVKYEKKITTITGTALK